MPAQYERMRDAFIRQGMRSKAAKAKAARIYNSQHPSAPVTGHSDPAQGGRGSTDNRDNRDTRRK